MDSQALWEILVAKGQELNWWQMSSRALIVFLVTLALVRLGKKRLFGRSTAMDVVLGVMLGSIMGRAINGSATLLPTIAATAILIGSHALFGKLGFYSHRLGVLFKGHPRLLVKDGEPIRKQMKCSDITQQDLEEALREKGKSPDLKQIAEAHLERDGKISIIPVKASTKVLEVKVENGVQTIRLEVG